MRAAAKPGIWGSWGGFGTWPTALSRSTHRDRPRQYVIWWIGPIMARGTLWSARSRSMRLNGKSWSGSTSVDRSPRSLLAAAPRPERRTGVERFLTDAGVIDRYPPRRMSALNY